MRKIHALFASFLLIIAGCSTDNNGNTTVIPLAPTNLTAIVISTTQVNLQWADNSTNESGYKVERKIQGGNFIQVGNTGENIAAFSDLNLTPNTTYIYRVVAYNSAGNSLQYSNEVTVTTNTTAPSTLINGLVGFWPFNGNANDESGNGNNGTVNGAALTSDRFGVTNSAYSFNGINSQIAIPFNNSQLSIDYAISVWFKLESFISSYPAIMYGYSTSTSLYTIRLELDQTDNDMNYYMEVQSGNPGIVLETNINTINTNTYYHLVINKSGNNTSVYINGQLNNSSAGISPNNLSNMIYIGENGINQGYKGKIDDVRIYNRALTQAEITYLATH